MNNTKRGLGKCVKAFVLLSGFAALWGCSNDNDEPNTNQKVNQDFGAQQSPLAVKLNAVEFDKPRDVKNFPDYIKALKEYAKDHGIRPATIENAFKDVYYVEHVVKADKNQPEKKATLDEYLARAVSPARINLAKQKYLAFHPQLRNATLLTNVPQTYILALWGVESAYGKYQGKEDIISALSTLAFDGRREQFFTKELMSALTILQNGHIDKSQFKGSWAGAMGQNQFMPSSYLTYGLDGDNDGKIDIWNNESDIFASTGNYLSTVGWNPKESWGNKIQLPSDFNTKYEGLEAEKSKKVADWLKTGIKFVGDKPHPNLTTKAWVIIPDAESGYGYLVYSNFKTLMHWNRSYYFAVSVGMLADSLTQSSLNTDEVSQ